MKQVAVVILNYNGRELLRQFLPSVIQHSGQAQIVVADNCSTDDSVKFLEEHFPSVTLIAIPENKGYSGGYNYALKKIEATYFVLLNSDVEVTPNWIEPVVQQLDSNLSIAGAQPKILAYHDKRQFEYAGAGGGFVDMLGYPFCRGRIFQTLEEDQGQFNDSRPIFWATGACLFLRSSAFHKSGGLDEEFFAHMEEIDLCWRLKRQGHIIYYVGASTVFHVGGGTLAASNPRKTYYNFRNGLSLLSYHLPWTQLIWKLPLRLILDWVAALKFATHSPRDGRAVLKAHAHFMGGLKVILQKRTELRRQLIQRKVDNVYPRLLVVDYYLLKMRHFNQLPPF